MYAHKPFTCYFCNSTINNESQENHNTICESVLEPCPHKCGAYFQRRERSKHLRKCKNNLYRRSTSDMLDGPDIPQQNGMGTLTSVSGRSTVSQQSSLYNNVNDRVSTLEKSITQLSLTLNNAKLTSSTHTQCNEKIFNVNRHVQSQLQLTQQQAKHVDKQLAQITYSQAQLHKEQDQLGKMTYDIQQRLMHLDATQQAVQKEQGDFLAEQLAIRRDLGKLNEFYDQENASVAALWMDQKREVAQLVESNHVVIQRLDEIVAKNAAINFDVRAVTRIATENCERLDIQEKDMRHMKDTMAQLQVDLKSIENIQSMFTDMSTGPPGRLLWRITDFASKMESAKENNTILKSPIFYSSPYGYKIRLILYLNGLKKWKGRHLIACLHVLKNDYDDLLKWPCFVEGSVTLKDLNSTDEKHHVKYISAKREFGDEDGEEPQESSTQYIFIPHSTLLKSCFIKENTIYLEVNITRTGKQETVI